MNAHKVSRSILFNKNKDSVVRIILSDLGNLLKLIWDAESKTEFHFLEILSTLSQRYKDWKYGKIKPNVPLEIFNAIDNVLINRGGMTEKMRNFYLKRESCKTTEFSYILHVGRLASIKPERIKEFETDFEDAIYKIMGDANVRIAYKPLRVIIDINTEQKIYLQEQWKKICELEKNKGLCTPGYLIGNEAKLYELKLLSHVGLSVMARSGYGKTQLLLSTVISLCRLNSPDFLSLIIVDPKERDFPALENLPHLACPIIYEYTQALVMLKQVMLELEKRRAQHLPKYNPIVVVFDELADLVDALGKNEKQELELIMKRIGQKGRSFGIFLIGASQRAYEVPEDIRNKLELKIAGRCSNNNDAYAATGQTGLDLTKLAIGEFEIHPLNERLKGFYIADDNSEDYQVIIKRYVKLIRNVWTNIEPHFKVLGRINETILEPNLKESKEEKFIEYCKQNSITAITKIIDAHKIQFGKGVGTKRAKEFREKILS